MKRKDIFKELILEFHHYQISEVVERKISIPVESKIVSVIGARRSGKTYILFQLIKKAVRKNIY